MPQRALPNLIISDSEVLTVEPETGVGGRLEGVAAVTEEDRRSLSNS